MARLKTIRSAIALLCFCSVALTDISSTSAQENSSLKINGATIDVAFTTTPSESLQRLVLAWIESSARAITVYYGQFPVSNLRVQVRFFDGRGARGGRTTGWDGAMITIGIGLSSNASDFASDWEMTHEMVHLCFPSVPDKNHWIEEGSATYVEPIARMRAGALTAETVWGDLVEGLPKGLPATGDAGLDFTPTWGRTYWGGALFCLLADVEIRKRTGNKKGLEDAFRGILKAGGTIESDWPMTRVIEIGDRATGVSVLRELYEKMKASPAPVDLDALWKELGVERRNGRVTFNDMAPLASVRKAITPSRSSGSIGRN